MNPQIDQSIDVTHYLRVLWRRRGILLLCSVTVLCTAFVMLLLTNESYTASTLIRIVDTRPMTRDVEMLMGGRQLAPSFAEDERRYAETVNQIRSTPFLTRVVRAVSLHEDPAIRERAESLASERGADPDSMAVLIAAEGLRTHIGIEAAGRGHYRILVESQSPDLASQLANYTTALFTSITREQSKTESEAAQDLGESRKIAYEDSLRASERKWEDARRVLLIERDLEGGLVRAGNLEFAKELQRKYREEARALRLSFGPPPRDVTMLLGDSTIAGLQADLYAALRADVTGRLASEAREIGGTPTTGTYNIRRRDILRDVDRRISDLHAADSREAHDTRTRATFSHMNLAVQAQIADSLMAWIGAFEKRVKRSPGEETQLARLQEDVERYRALLRSFEAEVLAAEVTLAAEDKLGTKIIIVERATPPLSPSHPDKQKVLLMALLLGPLVGVGLIFVAETMDRTLRTVDDFRRIAPEPILGTAPLLTRRAVQQPGRLRRHWVPVSVGAVLLLTVVVYAGGLLLRAPDRTRDAEADPLLLEEAIGDGETAANTEGTP